MITLVTLFDSADARGKKKKKKAGGGPAPTCTSLGLDCSATCCAQSGVECAEAKLDCAVPFKRPFTELYIGFGTILGITIGVSVLIGFVNFCLMFKFCQHYDENLDTYVGGCSLCDCFSCLLTCGLIFREKEQDGSQDELDFRKRFEKSLDRHNAELGGNNGGDRKKRERVGKDIKNYISANSKSKGAYGIGENEDDPFQN
jgi:hypothetical protein